MILGLGNGYIRVRVILGLGSHRGVVSRRIVSRRIGPVELWRPGWEFSQNKSEGI